MKKTLKWVGGTLLLLAALAGALIAWAMYRLSHDQPLADRPEYARYELGNGAADGSMRPDATGRRDGTQAGSWRILPPMPPEKPMDIHTAANYRKNLTLRSCFWPGPRARSGVFTNDSDSFSYENQFPDTATTYIPTAFRLPEGSKLVIRGDFPHMRHWNFNTYDAKGMPQDALSDRDINPDAGSANPFRPGVPRNAAPRRYTMQIVSGPAPAQRAPNTLYTNAAPGQEVFLWMRNYVPDSSIDYLGGVALPTVALQRNNGEELTDQAACDATATAMRGKQLPSSVDPRAWTLLTRLPWVDTANVGAKDAPVQALKAFFNRPAAVADLFFPWLAPSAPVPAGGWWSNLATRYGYVYLSRNFGKVYVATAKMPATPRTWHGETDNLAQADMRYMSFCTAGSLAASTTPDCIYDEQLASTVDDTGRYTLVVARQGDRPKNATPECGVAWIEMGNGDGLVSGSSEFSLLLNRHTQVNQDFQHSWFSVPKPGQERQAMGDYLPYVLNLKEKQNFEALGCPVDKAKLRAMLPTAG